MNSDKPEVSGSEWGARDCALIDREGGLITMCQSPQQAQVIADHHNRSRATPAPSASVEEIVRGCVDKLGRDAVDRNGWWPVDATPIVREAIQSALAPVVLHFRSQIRDLLAELEQAKAGDEEGVRQMVQLQTRLATAEAALGWIMRVDAMDYEYRAKTKSYFDAAQAKEKP